MTMLLHIYGAFAIFSVVQGARTRLNSLGLNVQAAAPSTSITAVCGKDPPWNSGSGGRSAIILRGETFRYDQTTNESETYRTIHEGVALKGTYKTSSQLKATESLLHNLVRPLEKNGEEVDMFSETYERPWHKQLMAEFGDRLKVDLKLNSEEYNQATSLLAGMQSLLDYASEHKIWYNHIYIVRHDLHIKQDLVNLASRQPDSFLYPFHITASLYSDMIFIFPGRFFGCFYDYVGSKGSESHVDDLKDPTTFPEIVTVGALVDGVYQTMPTKYDSASGSDGPKKAANPIYDFPARSRTDKAKHK